MIKSQHSLSYCTHCEMSVVICYMCKNNCCNGSSGIVNGMPCQKCDEAYDHQNIFIKNKKSITFKK